MSSEPSVMEYKVVLTGILYCLRPVAEGYMAIEVSIIHLGQHEQNHNIVISQHWIVCLKLYQILIFF